LDIDGDIVDCRDTVEILVEAMDAQITCVAHAVLSSQSWY